MTLDKAKILIGVMVDAALKDRELSLRKFAVEVSEDLDDGVSHQTIANWRSGKYFPDFSTLIEMREVYDDWRGELANDCLGVIVSAIS